MIGLRSSDPTGPPPEASIPSLPSGPLGLHVEAWEAVETLPPSARLFPAVHAVHLLICAGLRRFELGREIVFSVLRPGSLPGESTGSLWRFSDRQMPRWFVAGSILRNASLLAELL